MITIKVSMKKLENLELIALPICDNAYRVCQLVKRSFLIAPEIKLLELMGFNIETLEEK